MRDEVVQGKLAEETTLNGEKRNNQSRVGGKMFGFFAWLEQKLYSLEGGRVFLMRVSFTLKPPEVYHQKDSWTIRVTKELDIAPAQVLVFLSTWNGKTALTDTTEKREHPGNVVLLILVDVSGKRAVQK